MKRLGFEVGFRPGLGFFVASLGALFLGACSQSPPAFVEQPFVAVRMQSASSESDSSGVRGGCLRLTPSHSECNVNAGDSSQVGRQEGSTAGVDNGISVSNRAGSEGDSIGIPDVTDVATLPTPVPSPTQIPLPVPTAVATVAPTPVVEPPAVPTPRPGILHQQVVQQPDRGKVDILWVIDNSGSMEWAQQALASKFESFANQLLAANVDFQLGVTTTDMCRPDKTVDEFCPVSTKVSATGLQGNLVAVPQSTSRFLLGSSASVVDSFRAMAMRGTTGSSLEQGLSAAKYAVQKSAAGGFNAGFVRPDAKLSVVVLSDEEDDGVGMWGRDGYGNVFKDFFGNPNYALDSVLAARFPFANQHMTPERFVQELSGLKGEGLFQLNAITGVKNAQGQTYCRLDSNGEPFGPMEAGTNYIRAASLTGGIVQNVCGDWESILTNVGRGTVELTTRIQLESAPFPGSLEVWVAGVQWDSGFEYDASSKTVVFKTFPPYGAEVVVRYYDIVQ